jgi:hypothetical protein
MLTQEGAGNLVREKVRRLVNRQNFTALVQSNARTGVRGLFPDGLCKAQPPGRMTGVIVIVEHLEEIVADEREKGGAVDDPGLRLEKGVGAESLLVDFEYELSGAAVRQEGDGGGLPVHAEN